MHHGSREYVRRFARDMLGLGNAAGHSETVGCSPLIGKPFRRFRDRICRLRFLRQNLLNLLGFVGR
jgi:hypothetical protein